MSKNQNDFSNLGEDIKNLVADAVKNTDFEQLNKRIGSTINVALEEVQRELQKVSKNQKEQSFQQSGANPVGTEQFQGDVGQKSGMKGWFSKKESLFPVDKTALNTTLGITFIVLGSIVTFVSLIITGVFGIVFRSFSYIIPPLIVGLVAVSLFTIGYRIQKRKKRFLNYIKYMGNKKYIEIEELAKRSHQSLNYTTRDLKKLIKIGAFPDAHMDHHKRYFLGDYETYNLFLNANKKASKQEEGTLPKEIKEAARQGKEFVEEIRKANDLLPGEEISRKLDTLERITGNIFQRVQEKPELLSQIRKFMEYYLPTTKKLVNAYKEFDTQMIQGENVKKSKEDIEATLDTINVAFLNLYHSLFEEEVIEVNTDISVLQSMLAREGLTKKDFQVKEEL